MLIIALLVLAAFDAAAVFATRRRGDATSAGEPVHDDAQGGDR